MSTPHSEENELLSATVLDGLHHLCTTFPLELTKTLIANSMKLTLHSSAIIPPVPELYALHADKVKQSEYSVVTLYSIATKHCWDSLKLRHQLEAINVHNNAIDELTRAYEDNRKDLVLRQLQLGHNFPHITDVQWRIVCDVKSSTADSSTGAPSFYINLGQYRQHSGERDTIIEFVCNGEELQSLINRLKEIERHCDKLAINSTAAVDVKK